VQNMTDVGYGFVKQLVICSVTQFFKSWEMFCCDCVSRELLSAPTAGSRCFMKHLEQLEKASDTQTGASSHH